MDNIYDGLYLVTDQIIAVKQLKAHIAQAKTIEHLLLLHRVISPSPIQEKEYQSDSDALNV